MTSKRNYSRYFIILQEDEKGYSIEPNKFPTGYAKVERKHNKCKVSYYVQNLKSGEEPYYMFLICDRKKDKRLIKLGKINIDNYGRSEVSYEYDIENIANCNIPMDNIKGASIVKIDGSNVHGILTGFVSGADLDDWKSYVVIENEEREEKEGKDEDKELSNELNKEELKEVKSEKVTKEKNIIEENIFDKYEKEVENHKKTFENQDETRKDNPCEKEEFIKNNINDQCQVKGNIEDEKYEVKENIDDQVRVNTDDDLDGKDEENLEDGYKEEINIRTELERQEFEKEFQDESQSINDEMDDGIEIDDNKRKSKENKKDKKSKKSKEKLKEECKQDDKIKCKEKNEIKCKKNITKEQKCPHEGNCHMNWEKEFYKHIVEDLKEEKDICQEVGKCKWYKISHTSLMNMRPGIDFSKYSILYYPMMNYYSYIMKNGHYLVGFKYDNDGKMRYLVYAIPGTKSMLDQPFNGSTGFVTWVYKDIKNINPISMGYWLMFYDFKNSTVVIPVKK